MSSQGPKRVERAEARVWLSRCALLGLITVPFLATGCAVSSFSNPFGSSEESSAVSESRLLETAKADTGNDLPGGASTHCPQVVAWPRDRLLTIYEPNHVGDANAIVHRGEITKMARECQILPGRVVVKYGFAGRVLLGPKGKRGVVTLGVNVRVAGTERNTLATDKMKVTTTIPPDGPAGYFSMVREVSFPIQVGTRAEDYKIFVAFDRQVPNAG
jgi:hypothetical protein